MIIVVSLTVTTDRRNAAAAYLDDLSERLGQFTVDGELTVDDLLESPYLLFGTEEQIADQLRQLREAAGASYLAVFPHCMKTAPVMQLLS